MLCLEQIRGKLEILALTCVGGAASSQRAQEQADDVADVMSKWTLFVAFSGLFLRRDEERVLRELGPSLIEIGGAAAEVGR